MRRPFFYAAKNTWYAKLGDRKVSLGVRGEESEAEALEAWHKLMANGKPTAPAEAPTVATLVSAFLADAEARLKPGTVAGYKGFLEPFARLARYGTMTADRLTAKDAVAYSRKPEWSNSTRHGFLSALAIALKWGGYPIVGLKKPPMESRGDKALVSDGAHATLYQAAPDYFRPFLSLLHLTGARPGEVASITSDNFDEAGACVRLKEHKTARHGKARIVFLPPEAVAILREQRDRHGSGHLLRGCYGQPWTKNALVCMFRRLRKATGLTGVSAYGYRHGFATRALAVGVPDAQVAALLGHAGTAMLHRHYAHLTSQSQALRDALGRVR